MWTEQREGIGKPTSWATLKQLKIDKCKEAIRKTEETQRQLALDLEITKKELHNLVTGKFELGFKENTVATMELGSKSHRDELRTDLLDQGKTTKECLHGDKANNPHYMAKRMQKMLLLKDSIKFGEKQLEYFGVRLTRQLKYLDDLEHEEEPKGKTRERSAESLPHGVSRNVRLIQKSRESRGQSLSPDPWDDALKTYHPNAWKNKTNKPSGRSTRGRSLSPDPWDDILKTRHPNAWYNKIMKPSDRGTRGRSLSPNPWDDALKTRHPNAGYNKIMKPSDRGTRGQSLSPDPWDDDMKTYHPNAWRSKAHKPASQIRRNIGAPDVIATPTAHDMNSVTDRSLNENGGTREQQCSIANNELAPLDELKRKIFHACCNAIGAVSMVIIIVAIVFALVSMKVE
jgi:hypothetical protein